MINSKYLKEKFILIEENIEIAERVNNLKFASMLSGYLVVYISGIYEDCIEYLFIQRAGINNDEEIKNFVKTLIDHHFRNPNYENIKKMVKALDPRYKDIFYEKINNENVVALNSIINNKNNIAHGKSSNATIREIKNYHKNTLKIFEVLEEILLGIYKKEQE